MFRVLYVESNLLKQRAMISKAGNERLPKVIQITSRITCDPQIMDGKPCIRGMRVTVGMVLGQVRSGRSIENVLEDFPYLEPEDVLEALQYSS